MFHPVLHPPAPTLFQVYVPFFICKGQALRARSEALTTKKVGFVKKTGAVVVSGYRISKMQEVHKCTNTQKRFTHHKSAEAATSTRLSLDSVFRSGSA